MSRELMNRRQFMLASAAAPLAGAGWMAVLRDAVARSQVQSKPVLTEASFNTLVTNTRKLGSTATQELVSSLRADPVKFVRDRFTLTAVQDRNLQTLSATDAATITSAVEKGLTGANEFRLRLPSTMASGRCDWTAARSTKTLDGGVIAEVWTLTAAPRQAPPIHHL